MHALKEKRIILIGSPKAVYVYMNLSFAFLNISKKKEKKKTFSIIRKLSLKVVHEFIGKCEKKSVVELWLCFITSCCGDFMYKIYVCDVCHKMYEMSDFALF